MINETFPIEKKEKSEYKPLPENMYQVELLDVNVDEQETYNSKKNNSEPKVFEKQLSFQFVLLNGTDMQAEKEEFKNLRGRNIWANFIPTYLYDGKNGKNKLYQIIESLIGRPLVREEEATFDSNKLNELIGMQARIVVKNKAGKDNSVFSNIDTYLVKEQTLPQLTLEEKEKATVKKDGEENNPSEGTLEHPQYAPAPTQEEQEQTPIESIPF